MSYTTKPIKNEIQNELSTYITKVDISALGTCTFKLYLTFSVLFELNFYFNFQNYNHRNIFRKYKNFYY